MTTNFHSNFPNVQQEVCIEPEKFKGGQIPSSIIVTYQNRFSYNYTLIRVDENRNYCYRLIRVLGAFGKKKRKLSPCECTATISVTFPNPPPHVFGDPFIYNYTISDCATSASISNSSNSDIINAPPPSGSFLISLGDNGYPSSPDTISTITVVTDNGTCTSDVLLFPTP